MAGLSVYLVAAVAQTLVDLQNEWAVQTLVLVSFALQVFLLMFAWIRRQNVATPTRFLLWLAYQLADSTALFTLGHMAIRARSASEQQLMAFWAPFLLVHLGGQDTITAYSFEDNRLWLRHLQTLVVQFIGAAYILHKYIPQSQPLIRVASVIMFVVGAVKYGERIWALRSASMDSMWSSLDTDDSDSGARRRRESHRIILQELVDKRCNPLTDEDILTASHGLLDVCKGIFIGSLRARGWAAAACIDSVLRRCLREDRLDMLLEMELSLMYDILYTKAAVINTWWGRCVRVATPAATAAALLLFLVTSKDGHRDTDVIITYVLLAGALLLETASLVRAAASTWTVASLHAMGKGWATDYYDDLRGLRLSLGVTGYRRWSGTVGQYSLLKSWAKDMAAPPAVGRVAELVGLGSWWHQTRRWRSAKVKGLTKELVREILEMDSDRRNVSSRAGLLTLRKYELLDAHGGEFPWSVDESDIEGSIIAWHVATDLYHQAAARDKVPGLLQASQELSRYMMFLLVVRPYMLPGPVRRNQYGSACARLNAAINAYAGDGRLDWVLSTVTEHLRNKPLTFEQVHFLDAFLANSKFAGDDNPAVAGFAIANKLRSNSKRLQVIFGVWVEMLCFVADHCSRESHAAQLSSGGELLTIAWLMAKHANLPTITTADDTTEPKMSAPSSVPKCKYIPSWEANLNAMEEERKRRARR